MKKIFAALGWLALFAALGAVAMGGLAVALTPHHIPLRGLLKVAEVGAGPGGLAWAVALIFAALPGARLTPGRFGLAQGVWGVAGTVLMMLCGGTLPFLAAVFLSLLRILRHLPSRLPNAHSITLLAAALLASELLGALWLVWYVRRQGTAVVEDGSARGIAWREAPGAAYRAAGLAALGTLVLAAAEFRLVPPDMSKLHDLPLAELYQGPPFIIALVLVVTIFFAPVVEEVLFRGLAFAGIAARLGPGWAVFLTTAVFTALHAAEKRYYPLGFVDVAMVALLACFLRLRYRSIKPGILLHFLYNFGMLLVPVLG